MKTLKQLAKRLFQYEARAVLKKYKPKIVAVSGSVGKTLTKEVLYQIMSKNFFVRKSQKSIATDLGISLAIIGRPDADVAEPLRAFFFSVLTLFFTLKLLLFKCDYPEWLILEADGDKPGDLEGLSKWLNPDILIVTAIGEVPAHIETFDSDPAKFLAEKINLINSVKRDGTIFYNGDDEFTGRLLLQSDVKKISCGLGKECDVKSEQFEIVSGKVGGTQTPVGMKFEIEFLTEKYPVTVMDSIGDSILYATLLACSAAQKLGVPFSESAKIAEKSALLPGRMKIINGIKNSTIIDDSYNSSPIAARQALNALSRIETNGRKIAVMGDMLELGRFSADEHKSLAGPIKSAASFAVCVGIRARRTGEELLSLGFPQESLACFDTSLEAGEFLKNEIKNGDIVLVKGSQNMRMERTVEAIMRHPEDKEKFLVRQEPEWLERK